MKCPHCGKDIVPKGEPEGFTEWWAAYPRREGKGQARRAYSGALQKTSKEVLLAAANSYRKICASREKQFVRLASTFLAGEGWLDEGISPIPPLAEETSTTASNLHPSWQVTDVDKLKSLIGPEKFTQWLAPTELIRDSRPGWPVKLVVTTSFRKDWIDRQFRAQLFQVIGPYEIKVKKP